MGVSTAAGHFVSVAKTAPQLAEAATEFPSNGCPPDSSMALTGSRESHTLKEDEDFLLWAPWETIHLPTLPAHTLC